MDWQTVTQVILLPLMAGGFYFLWNHFSKVRDDLEKLKSDFQGAVTRLSHDDSSMRERMVRFEVMCDNLTSSILEIKASILRVEVAISELKKRD